MKNATGDSVRDGDTARKGELAPASGGPLTSRTTEADPVPAAKAPWTTPRLVCYGDLRSVTMGPSPSVGESGPSGIRKLPP